MSTAHTEAPGQRRWLSLVGAMLVIAITGSIFGGKFFGAPVEYFLFGGVLLGIALFHQKNFEIALSGLLIVTIFKFQITGFHAGPGLEGLIAHVGHEWTTIANLACLLLGFAILARHFQKSRLPEHLPKVLPKNPVLGAFALLVLVYCGSTFLDNIAAAMIGGALALMLWNRNVHLGYVAAIVAASNAGGSGSVLGDTTTTMMWIDGVAAIDVSHAFIASAVALVVFGIPASFQQARFAGHMIHSHEHRKIEWHRLGVVIAMLVGAATTNFVVNSEYPEVAESWPWIGTALWVVIILSAGIVRHDWEVVREDTKNTAFLLCLVFTASLMPVEQLPEASAVSTFGLGFLSAVFDNIPLTALGITQGGYDWGVLAFAVGFGGSMTWFGSSAGVAVSNLVPEARNVKAWVKAGWHIPLGYIAGFLALSLIWGWNPHAPHKDSTAQIMAVNSPQT